MKDKLEEETAVMAPFPTVTFSGRAQGGNGRTFG